MTPNVLPDIVALAPNPWQGTWMNRQQLLNRLARRGWPVTYSTGPLNIWDRNNSEWAEAPLLDKFENMDGVRIDVPGRLLPRWPTVKVWDQFSIARHARRLAQSSNPHLRILYIFHPLFAPYLDRLPSKYLVYHAYDSFALSGCGAPDAIAQERRLIERADLLIASSEAIARKLPAGPGYNSKVLQNGASVEEFRSAASAACPEDLATIPHPRIGYIGAVNFKVDFGLIAAIARQKPEWHWVMIGEELMRNAPEWIPDAAESQEHWKQCHNLPNIHFLGQKDRSSVPSYVNHMDVNAMCYRTSGGWWEAGYPLKMHEYLAVGKPVVASNLEAIQPFQHVIDIADGTNAWIAAIHRALMQGGVATADDRRRVAQENSWDNRTDTLDMWLREMISPS